MNNKNIKLTITDYIVTFFLLANSGFPFFTNNPYLWISFSFILSFFVLFHNKKTKLIKNSFFIKILILLTILIIGQIYVFYFFDIKTTTTLFIRWIYPFFTIAYLGLKFPQIYVKQMYFFSIISLIFFIPSVLIPGFERTLLSYTEFFNQQAKSSFYIYNPNILIYTVKKAEGVFNLYRNSGPFWEAGGFGVYLNLAIIINTIYNKNLFNKYNIIFVITLISTLSTASFLAFFIFISFYQAVILKKVKNALFFAPFIVIFSIYLFTSEDIFRVKIERQITTFENMKNIKYSRRNRMASAIIDIGDLKRSPIFGVGRNSLTRFGTTEISYLEHRNNGLTDFLLKYGLPFFLLYFYYIYKSLKIMCLQTGINKKLAVIGFVVILIVGFSQTIFQQSIFIALFFYYSIINKNEIKKPLITKKILLK